MQSPAAFLRDESGAVSVDYVVLTAGAAAVALATLLVTSGTVRDWFRLVETGVVDNGIASGTWAAAMRDYQPYNPMLHGALLEDFAILEDEELDTLEAYVNAYVAAMEPLATNESDTGMLTDLNFAVGHAYMSRVRDRPYGEIDGIDPDEVGRIAVKMGWDDGNVSDMFGAPVDPPTSF